MSTVWTRVVEDLEKYSQPKVEKTFLQRMWNIVFKGSCAGECNQGRNACNCEKKNG
jgi:hypothetical protein